MELLLNLVWILLTLSGGAAYVSARRRSSARLVPGRCATGLLTIACAAVLLFPVISATDDLHPAQCVVEEAGKRVKVAVSGINSPIERSFWLASAVLLMAWPLFSAGEGCFAVLTHAATLPAATPRGAVAQRGPPAGL